jgi:hypothetical protein
MYKNEKITMLVGLPGDMLEPDRKTIVLLKILQRKGLNRDLKRKLAQSTRTEFDEVAALSVAALSVAARVELLPEQDKQLVRRWADPVARGGRFWTAISKWRNGKTAFDSIDFAKAIDLLFLEDFDPNWTKLSFDEESLLASCPCWPELRQGIERAMPSIKATPNFGVFMLWPRIVEELTRWEVLGDARQRAVSHAVFALCSAGFTDWFACRAVELCPGLQADFVISDLFEETAGADAATAREPWSDDWDCLLERLDEVGEMLHANPTREAVAELVRIGEACSALSEHLPRATETIREQVRGRIAELIERCRAWGEKPDFSWLDEATLNDLEGSWLAALAAADGQSENLAQDVHTAGERTDAAGRAYEAEAKKLRSLRSEFDASGTGNVPPRSMAERRAVERQRLEKEQELINRKRDLAMLQDDFLAAACPFGELPSAPADEPLPGDGESNGIPVAAELEDEAPAGKQVAEVVTTEPVPVDKPPAASGEICEANGAASRAGENEAVDSAAVSAATEKSERAPVVRSPEPPAIVVEPNSGAALPDECQASDADAGIYSVSAGEACRPIWESLATGKLSLAYQYAIALQARNGDLKTPPMPLLESVALAHELVFPDGTLREAVASGLEQLSEAWFHEDGPPAWHQAINLLLVAATLRPMILAPGSAASTVAGYLHLDSEGRYKHLYALVQDLRSTSERLLGFRIELASIRSAMSQAAVQMDLSALQAEARDWLNRQAPAVTIKFAAATKVWHAWLKPDGVIHRLISPVVANDAAAVAVVRTLIEELSDQGEFRKLVRKTDRTENGRLKGEDIHSGALDHLGRAAQDGISLARRWSSAVESQRPSNDQMRKLLLEVRDFLERNVDAIRAELNSPAEDHWNLMASAQRVCLREFDALQGLFDPQSALPTTEPGAAEVLAKDLLLIRNLRLSAGWQVVSNEEEILLETAAWLAAPADAGNVFAARLERGDLLGAALMLQSVPFGETGSDLNDDLRRASESWRAQLRNRLADVRRKIEIGSAYGYVSDADRRGWEGRLVALEAEIPESGCFDQAFREILTIDDAICSNHDSKAALVQSSLDDLRQMGKEPAYLDEVAKALAEGDVATANELLKRVRDGLPPWPEDAHSYDPFAIFMPIVRGLEDWLSDRKGKGTVEQTIKKGEPVPGLDLAAVPGMQRDQAAKMFEAWRFIKLEKAADANKLQTFLGGIGFVLTHPPQREDKTQGREIWRLTTDSVEDRLICPVPHFGSTAKGNYRVMCLWEHPTVGDIVQLVGDSSLHRPTIVLYFGRISERKWGDIARKTKVAHKSFLLIDEVMLLFLAGQAGSRLAAAFSTGLPLCYSDPYDATAGLVPPEMFFGRRGELQAVQGLNGRCFIYGGRQLGKTALMRRAEQSFHAPGANRYSAWIDLRAEGIGVSREAQEVWVPIASSLGAIGALDPGSANLLPTRKTGPDRIVKEVQAFLNAKPDRRILLLLDEADRFFEQDGRQDFAETRRLKQLMDNTQRRFKVVFAGLHNVLRMTERANHPLAHFGEPIKIGPFIDEAEIREAQDLVKGPLLAAGFKFDSPSLVIRILAQTNYYPSLIQLYCQHLLKHMLTKLESPKGLPGPRYSISSHDIEAVYSSGDLRDEIRQKFRLTLQLDFRYEVIAYAMALSALGRRYPHDEGVDWRSIWQNGAMQWWPEGFRDTSELDFRVLLDEMVELGVLSRSAERRYGLRNPNIFLLLGNQDEIEAVLVKDRQPAEEFDSATFHPPVRGQADSLVRYPLTYQQLTELMRMENSVFAIAGSRAADMDTLIPSVRTHLESLGAGQYKVIDGCGDQAAFKRKLEGFKNSLAEGLTVVLVPASEPWSGVWVREAKHIVDKARYHSKFLAVVFLADPEMLWGCVADDALNEMDIPWMSLLPWRESFLRQWLSDLKLPAGSAEQLGKVTGCWPKLLYSVMERGMTAKELERRIASEADTWRNCDKAAERVSHLGLSVRGPRPVLGALAEWGEPAEPEDLSKILEIDRGEVDRALRWAELLGLARREGHDFWTIDPTAQRALISLEA